MARRIPATDEMWVRLPLGASSVVEVVVSHIPSKDVTRVRFPYRAYGSNKR